MFFLTIKLKEIVYSEDNIGNDIQVKISIAEKMLQFGCNISNKKIRKFKKIVYQKNLPEEAISLPINIWIVEKDPIFDDEGRASGKIYIIPQVGNKENYSIDVKVIGSGGDRGDHALFTFKFEIIADTATRYTANVWPNGWVYARFDYLPNPWPIPFQLEVELTKITNGREYFVVKEGRLEGKTGSVRLKSKAKSYLLRKGERYKSAKLIYDRADNKLTIEGLGTYVVEMDSKNPIPLGTYDLELPYEPHPHGRRYMTYSKYAKTWFRIGHTGDRFLHTGRFSEGCITVKNHSQWTPIYNRLIRSRKDKKSVGILIVQ